MVVEIVRMDWPEEPGCIEDVLGLKEVVGAFAGAGDKEAESDKEPDSPTLVKPIVEVEEPWATKLDGDGGLAESWMSPLRLRFSVTEWTMVPLVAVTVIV